MTALFVSLLSQVFPLVMLSVDQSFVGIVRLWREGTKALS